MAKKAPPRKPPKVPSLTVVVVPKPKKEISRQREIRKEKR